MDAFAELVTSSRARVRAIAMRILGDSAEAEDVSQETYVRAHRAFGTLRDDGAALAWIGRIAHHTAVDHLRVRIRQRRVEDIADDAARASRPDDLALSAERRAFVHEALRALPEPHRRVLELQAEGLTAAQIAQHLGIAVGTVESRLHRARRSLKQRLIDIDCDRVCTGRRTAENSSRSS